MDGATRHEGSHHAHKHHHHGSHHGGADFDQQVDAARDAWAAWKSHDPAAWDAALDLRDRIGGKAWRHAMHQIDKEEAAQKREAKEHLPSVTIHGDEHAALGGTSSRLPSGRNYYDGSHVPGYYDRGQQDRSGQYRDQSYVEQQSTTNYGYQADNYYSRPQSVRQYRSGEEGYSYDTTYVTPQTRYYPQTDSYQYSGQGYSNDTRYYPQQNGYYPNQSGYYPDQNYRYYPQQNSGYYSQQDSDYYPQNSGGYYGWGNQGYSGNYGHRHNNLSWLAPVIGGGAGAIFDHRNRWRGTVIGSALGTALGAVIQDVSGGGFGSGYGGNGIYY